MFTGSQNEEKLALLPEWRVELMLSCDGFGVGRDVII